MLKSMTGYGRVCISFHGKKFTIEVQSLNRKFFESYIVLPKDLMRFEVEIKSWLSKKIRRGQVTVRIVQSNEIANINDILPNEETLYNLSNSWMKIAEKLKFDKKQITLNFLVNQLQLLPVLSDIKDEESLKKKLKEGIDQALDKLIEMKLSEGSALAIDIKKRLRCLSSELKTIKQYAPNASEKLKERLLNTLNEFFQTSSPDERILKEIAIYSDKVDINEEISRLYSHIDQFEKILIEKEDAVGRKMDFLIQEMVREINTIAAKSNEIKISESVIVIKTELERIREQVQNIE